MTENHVCKIAFFLFVMRLCVCFVFLAFVVPSFTLWHQIRESLLQVYQDEGPTQKRLAAYLILIRSRDRHVLRPVIEHHRNQERDPEVRSFVASHLANLWGSAELKQYVYKEAWSVKGLALMTNSQYCKSPCNVRK